MAKLKEGIKKVVRVKEGSSITVSTTFIYQVSIATTTNDYYCLEDAREIMSKKYIEDSLTLFVKDKVSFFKKVELISAPKEWIAKNKT